MFVELAKLYFELTGDFIEKLLYWQKENCSSSSNNSKGALSKVMFVELAKLYFELTGDFIEKLLYWQKENCNSSSNNSKGASCNWPKREQLP